MQQLHPTGSEEESEKAGGCIMDEPQSAFLYATSYFSLVAFAYALYREHYSLSIVPAAVFVTSIMYWSNPLLDCYERYIDIVCVQCALFYQLYRARNAEYLKEYIAVTVAGVLSFTVGYCLFRFWNVLEIEEVEERSWKMWIVAYFHSGVHIFGNLANMILYSGGI